MNIKARIVARKIVLVYFYERYFIDSIVTRPYLLEEIEKIDKIIKISNPQLEDIEIATVLQNGYYDNVDEEIAYVIRNFFGKFAPQEIDMEYVMTIAPTFSRYKPLVEEVVDTHARTFNFSNMDLMDRVLFVLGYAEYSLLKTPKEVLLNEMIELAKRYGDDSSPKLVNGIGHHMLQSIDANEATS